MGMNISDEKVIYTYSADETYAFAKTMGEEAKAGEVYCLIGDLGTGKTVFAQGFAAGVEVTDTVNSPTFTIVQLYEDGRIPFYHFDVYRIGDPEEMFEVGYDEYVSGDGVCLIEWADMIEDILPKTYCRVIMNKDMNEGTDYRKIVIQKIG